MNATKYKTVSLLLTVAVMTACSKTAQLTPKQSLDDQAQEPKASQQMPAMKGTGTLQPEDTNPFSFVAFGDSQGETNNPTLKAIFKDMETVIPKPSFALSLGDIIQGEPSATDDFTAQIEKHLGDALELNK
ncbi:MAG: hypothetical protein O7G87_06975, partial [bacterium]|nr:hypothetical protein [bacterium]